MDDRNEVPLRSPAIEKCVEEEALEWYRMTPQERWEESMRLWSTFRLLGGRFEPGELRSAFHDMRARPAGPDAGLAPVRVTRRGGI
jgi:hypothetical protein